MKRIWTSEAVTRGHPDKICDQVADAIVDAALASDPAARVACEAALWQNDLWILGEMNADPAPACADIARAVLREIGYGRPGLTPEAQTCRIHVHLRPQSPDIARGVEHRAAEDTGAGDQGTVFGYACRETEWGLPLLYVLATRLAQRLEQLGKTGAVPWLLPDGKAQVSVEYRDGVPARIATVVLSAQHTSETGTETVRSTLLQEGILPVLPPELVDAETLIYINPTGRFALGGSAADTGMTGQKLMADTYGGLARHGGGTLSGKDPTKTDRTGAYLARYLAKNLVFSGLASRCEVQLAYAIGLADPVSVAVNTFGTGAAEDALLAQWLEEHVDMRPGVVIRRFGLDRPIYQKLTCYGHFGENAAGMPWERLDMHIPANLTSSQ